VGKRIRIRAADARFQQIEGLKRSRAARRRQDAFFLEGVRAIDRAQAHGVGFRALVWDSERKLSAWARSVLDRAPEADRIELTPALMEQLSDRDERSELAAIVARPADDLARIPLADDLLVVVVDRPSSPGNLGALLRTADAFGAHGLIATGHGCDLYEPRGVRASAGSLFSVPAVSVPGPAQVAEWLARARAELGEIEVVGSSARGDAPLGDTTFSARTVVVLGNETHGMSQSTRALCDRVAAIPMWGDATSLNLTSAAAILLWEARRTRPTPSP